MQQTCCVSKLTLGTPRCSSPVVRSSPRDTSWGICSIDTMVQLETTIHVYMSVYVQGDIIWQGSHHLGRVAALMADQADSKLPSHSQSFEVSFFWNVQCLLPRETEFCGFRVSVLDK